MDININVKIDAPGVIEAILALADVLDKRNEIKERENEGKEKIFNVDAENREKVSKEFCSGGKGEEVKEGEEITLEVLREFLIGLSRGGKQGQVRALLDSLGFNKLTDAPKESYGKIFEMARKLGS